MTSDELLIVIVGLGVCGLGSYLHGRLGLTLGCLPDILGPAILGGCALVGMGIGFFVGRHTNAALGILAGAITMCSCLAATALIETWADEQRWEER